MEKPKVTAIMATCGRHACSERSLSLFLNQTYENKHLLIYQNSKVVQELDINIPTDKVTLINNHIDSQTGESYQTLGAIYNDAIKHIPEDTDIITFWDDDDLFLINHLEKGINGYLKAVEIGMIAYKPAKSYYRYHGGVALVNNTLEPSMFVKADHILEHGFYNTTSDQHLKWVNPLVYSKLINVDIEGDPTLIYNWGDSIPTFKTSGDPNNPSNFNNYRTFSSDHGDRIISKIDVSNYYNLI